MSQKVIKAVCIICFLGIVLPIVYCKLSKTEIKSKPGQDFDIKSTTVKASDELSQLSDGTEVQKDEEYTTFIFRYYDGSNTDLSIINKFVTVSDSKTSYSSLKDAEKSEAIKNYKESSSEVSFMLKNGFTYTWDVNPSDTKITKSSNAKDIPISVLANDDLKNKVVGYKVTLDYSKDVMQPVYHEIVK